MHFSFYSRLSASDTIADFRRWLYTADASYMFASDRSLEWPEPPTPDQAKTDMLRAPRWIIQNLVEARRGMMEAERKWSLYANEANQLKLQLAQLSDQTALKEEVKKKDDLIKKLNNGLRMLYGDLEKKSSALKEREDHSDKLTEQLKALAKLQSTSLAGTKTAETLQSLISSDDNRRMSAMEDEGKKDKEELRKLRGEVSRLKFLIKGSGGNVGADIAAADPPAAGEPVASGRPSLPRLPSHALVGVTATNSARSGSIGATERLLRSEVPETARESFFKDAQWWLHEPVKRAALANLLLRGELTVVDMLGKSVPAGKELEDLSAWLVKLFIKQDMHMDVMEHLIDVECEKTKAMNTLFRGEEISSRVLRVYTRKRGSKYAYKVLNDLVQHVSDNNLHLEIDPNRATPQMNLKQNLIDLEALTQRFFDKIVNSITSVPPEFMRLCNRICIRAEERFPDSEDLAVAGFIFLRFLCPAISSPEGFKLYPVATPEARRTLLLVGKILQNLANGVQFKEDYLAEMNRFLAKNQLAMHEFFVKCRTYPPAISGESAAVYDIARLLHQRRDKVRQQLEPFLLHNKTWTFKVNARLDERARTLLSNLLPNGQPAADLATAADKLQSVATFLSDNDDALSQLAIVIVAEQDVKVRQNLADALVTVLQSTSSVEFLARAVVQTEVSQSFTAYGFLHQSLTKAVFSTFAARFCAAWIRSVVGELINNVVSNNLHLEVDESRLTAEDPLRKGGFNRTENVAKLVKLTHVFLDTLAQSLTSAPRPMWSFANVLINNTSQDVFQFMALNFFCLAIETPDKFAVTEKPKREASRSLQLISDVIRNYANNNLIVVEGVPADSEVTAKYQGLFTNWGRSPPLAGTDNDSSPVAQPQLAASVTDLLRWMHSKFDSALAPLLQKYSSKHDVRYGIDELLGSINPAAKSPAKDDDSSSGSAHEDQPPAGLAGKDLEKWKKEREKEKEKERKRKEKEKKEKDKESKKKEKDKEKEKKK